MNTPPAKIDGAEVIWFSVIDDRHQHTGNCRQIVAGVVQPPAAGLAICKYDSDDSFYLFGCDSQWNQLTDTCHASLREAKNQAEFEYEGVLNTWEAPAGA